MVKDFMQNKKIAGFSLLEASVTMLIVGIFTALCANAYTKRHITYQESDGHGRYECYYSGGVIAQRYVENGSARNVQGSTCVFRPPRYAKYFLINVSGGGTAAAAGKFDSIFYTSLGAPLTISPGGVGGSSTLKMGDKTIHSTSGGGGEVVVTSSTAETVASCTLTPTPGYDCGSTPSCAQSGTNIKVNYCTAAGAGNFTSKEIPLADVKAYRYTYSGDTLTYKDLTAYTNYGYTDEAAAQALRTCTGTGCLEVAYTMTVKFVMQNEQQSQMVNYLSALGIEDGIADVNPGGLSSPGAVLILW